MINEFCGEWRWLSNFWPVSVEFDGIVYGSVENAYQASKVPIEDREQFTRCSAGQAKRLGKRYSLSETQKLTNMKDLLRKKFSDSTLRKLLLATENEEIVEGNSWGDVFWGVCRGVGENRLGKMIMEIREEIRNGEETIP